MSIVTPPVMPILYNDDNWYVCGLGVHNEHEVVEVVDRLNRQTAVLSGPAADNFLEEFSGACLSPDPDAVADFMSGYQGLMHPVNVQ